MGRTTFISYAPNCEDVVLARALGTISPGRYADWGDEPAEGPSVTKAFYDRGWHGVTVRPDPAQAAALAALRPRDTVAATGTLPGGTLHFLRVGHRNAADTLAGLDVAGSAPWIVVVPDDAPGVGTLLAEMGYAPLLFDGVNRFHLAPTQPHLAPFLAAPANMTDDFVRVGDLALGERLAGLQAALAAEQARSAGSAQRQRDALAASIAARGDVAKQFAEADWLRGLIAQAREAEAKERSLAAWLRQRLDEAQERLDGRVDEAAWLRQRLDEAQERLAGRADEAAWLRGCIRDAEIRVDLAQASIAAFEQDRLRRKRLRNALADWVRANNTGVAWRLTAPARAIRRRLLGRPSAPGQPAVLAPPTPVLPPLPAPQMVPPGPPLLRNLDHTAEPLPPPPAPQVVPPGPPLVRSSDHMAEPLLPVPAVEQPTRGPVAAVHQFHAGSAVGDAITNAMLLIRKQLRDAGFRSEIFVENVGIGLEQEVLPLAAIPHHDGYVLLMHHSMGYPSFDAVVALPAPKLLIYHNITPPGLLNDVPINQAMAVRGRAQLAAMRGRVVAALADSEYNAAELRRLGFGTVRPCTLLFDPAVMRQAATGPRPHDGVFVVLFVGRVTPSKGQADLVDAFALFHRQLGRPSRLVLVGALDPDEGAYIGEIERKVAEAGLRDAVHLPGKVSDAELLDWYRQANLYVSLSHHEGFGVPLVEAMAHSVPVIAWPTGAVPFTLDGYGTLLSDRTPASVADAMLAVAADPAAGYMAPGALDRFSLPKQMPALLEALALAGAVAPPNRTSRAALAANLRLLVTGHVTKTYSLANVNRGIARLVEAQRPGTVRLCPVEGAPTTDLSEVPEPDRALVASLAGRDAPESGPELVLSGHYPVHVPDGRGDLLACLFFWEESLVPAATVSVLNAGFDAVFAPSAFVNKVLVDSGVAIPVVTIGQAPALDPLLALPQKPAGTAPFCFLHVSSAFPRKGVDVLLAAWARAFGTGGNLRLLLKTFPNPHNDTPAQLARFRAAHPGAAPVELVDEDLPPDRLAALYGDADAMVLPTRGEGYNLPAAEAMAAGVPLIVTGHGGHMDFCSAATARLLRHGFGASGSHIASPHSLWAEPEVDDLAAALRDAASGLLAPLAAPARAAIRRAADPAVFVARLSDAAAAIMLAPAAEPVRVAWVSSWDVPCGVAEYSRTLLASLPRDRVDLAILADDRTEAAAGVQPCWQAGGTGIRRLLDAVSAVDAGLVVVQHQPGLLPWPVLARLVQALAAAGRGAVVTLHNTLHLLDIPEAERGATVAALRRAARLLVHTVADLDRLHGLGLGANTTLMPHPALPALAPPPPVRALPPDEAPLIGCTGFFLPDKGIPALIAAAAALRATWPGLRLLLVNAAYPHPNSEAEIAACRAAAEEAGLAVEWETAFLPLERQSTLLAACDLLVLPYQRSKESSSAALRSALATGVPVAVTPLALFDEAGDAVARLPGLAPADIATGLQGLLADTEQRAALVEAGRHWLSARAAPAIAARLHGMLLGLAAQQRVGAPSDGALWVPPPG